MNLTQILAWLAGPGGAIILSWIGEQWSPWQNWKPRVVLGFDPKATVSLVVTAGIGFVAYLAATNIPATTITQLDPYVSMAFPFIAFAAGQIWHAIINKRLAAKPTAQG